MSEPHDLVYDVAVIGGGVNGCGIARDAAGRGAKVLLLEAGDLAGGTSSASTKLIHGGLRYLEHYEFGLVRESLSERERLWAIAPHIAWPMRFVLPYVPGLRPRWLVRMGLFLYDHIGGRKRLPATETVALARHPAGAPLKAEFTSAFVYSDCWVDDARLVVLNARDAADRGADVRTHCRVTFLRRESDQWQIEAGGDRFSARAVINAAGPGVVDLLDDSGLPSHRAIRLVRGSHIVVRKLFNHAYSYFFQLPDGRIFFAIPYEQDFTLIGTTDVDHDGGPIAASADEIAYLCEGASRFFRQPVDPQDVVWTFSGVRPLIDDGSGRPEAATRGYDLDLSDQHAGAPLLSVFGGKITTYRHLAQEAVEALADRLPILRGPGWTDTVPLPGGDFAIDGAAALEADFAAQFPFLAGSAHRLVRAYGTTALEMFAGAKSLADCGRDFGHGLTEREVRHLADNEWARSADDVLWRRTKLGLRLSLDQAAALNSFILQEYPR
ncbi:glycerol-3-phosphate dehydrogenase [Novosphingobium sp.]|uniref:glycerol-3-phosphate dehydrogenase n=1 Tax=Novosphingobium sp. TaxID=1874826 RepID=UPI0025DDA226|nr:glycerol-3-phosphate dehydrogenase [Novosphingobium sp.]